MANPQKILVIYNPRAGQKKRRIFRQTLDHLKASAITVDVRETRYAGHAREIACNYKDGPYDKICAAGGDGTINEVLNGLYPSPLPLGIIPLGTANVLAKEISLIENPEKISEIILQDNRKDCWLGKVNGQYFALMASMGPDAEAVNEVNLSLKKKIGKAAYILSFLKQILIYRPVMFKVQANGKTHYASAVIISNGRYYGGEYLCAPDADMTKREFHIILFRKKGRFAALAYALKMITNKIPRDKSVQTVTAKNITISADQATHYQTDGDPGDFLPANITLSERPVSILCR
ncbi:Transcription regulator [contains diacylglycerol kinase catalytic domain] [hydrothermal vent metagenome]|uniref:Transcription regulator [contains diacylglycerol kinase catalytic domain] n=1 Tax=hydrothermal vent metagenome TaxID=652676 RepID=A0A3B0SL11_9ZZZZ